MNQCLPDDPTLDEIRTALAPLLGLHAAFDGWNEHAVIAAGADLGIDTDVARLAMKGGTMNLIDAWIESVDLEMARRLPPEKLGGMKIRARIAAMITTRLEIMAPNKDALRRAMAIMAMPQNFLKSSRIGWRSADRMWRLAGDDSSDFNHYTKRITLSAVYASTLAVYMNDDAGNIGENMSETLAFLDRRIDNVMQFEKLKAQAKERQEFTPSLSRFVGRLRYPAR